MTRSGELKDRITFQELQTNETWTTYRTVWAKVERTDSDSIRVVCRLLPLDMNIHRIVWRGTIWEITGLTSNEELNIDATSPLEPGLTLSI